MSNTDIGDFLQSLNQQQNEWSFVVSDQWVITMQSLSVVSLLASLGVLAFMTHIFIRHRKYLERLSLRISGYVALADILNSITQILTLNNDLMIKQTRSGLRFILWLSMFSTLWFVFLTLCISMQLHLSTLTKIRVGIYMKLEKFYIPASLFLAVLLPGIAVGVMDGIFWIPYMHSFNWPTENWRRKLTLWMCNYVWIVLTVVYCSVVAMLLSLRIWVMWRNSVEVIEAPRMPEKWDWNSLTESARTSAETIVSSTSLLKQSAGDTNSTLIGTRRVSFDPMHSHDQASMPATGGSGRGYLLTVMRADKETGQTMAVRSYVDKKRFLRSIQRLACYPLVPIITQLGVVAMNMVDTPTKGLYIYGMALASTSGLLNLGVFLLNPALPDIWKDAALGQTL
ncbi:hypothetical protein IW140_006041 [Coemansia sp. RSA 1813]|nr:hypothetical protein EV178_006110 [Coemansia sp. RSA 1646]KAJ1766880.1 hypothetical protein LPJ74_005654 [Coemansia sp. RSA 1843]KAJ2085831.1 hypothetical protein IW138_006091 [Coemansia sp. RSA 986]KAJ2210681.1 hypothetical protein EV179_006064 [Coemansia sp. RSA 487]KAJ2563646.1 hypothetical protein IW140_006041 [Coemansia sp. RSA 1813]